MTDDFDILAIRRGLIVAPAGCGKTQRITDALGRYDGKKPVLILTHTNAGVAALRSRLDKVGVPPARYRLSTIDGWAIRLITTFPERSGHDHGIVESPDYPKIRVAAANLLKQRHIDDILYATYSCQLVDEYQDCSHWQHAIVYYASAVLPTCVMGDDMQAIFGFGGDVLADWDKHVCVHFPVSGELTKPWRWINARNETLGDWLLKVRGTLREGGTIDLREAPPSVEWVALDGINDHALRLQAGAVKPPDDGRVLIIAESTSPQSQRRFASQTPGAIAVESVDLGDLVRFASNFDIQAVDALKHCVEFAQELMTNVGAADLLQRADTIVGGRARKQPTTTEAAAVAFQNERTFASMVTLFSEINRQGGVRVYRPAVLQALMRAIQICERDVSIGLDEAVIQMREQNRHLGRPLPRRAVGSTLLLKGLEAEVAVILSAETMDAKNLYVALTRGSKKIIVCSKSPVLPVF